jgi:hypothetical protein
MRKHVAASAALAQLLFNRVQPFSESAIYGAGFSGRDSCRGDLGQYPGLKRCDLIQRHLLDLSYPHLKRRRAGCFHGVRRRTDYGMNRSGIAGGRLV